MVKTILEKLDNYEKILKIYNTKKQLLILLQEEEIEKLKNKLKKILNN